MSEHTYRQMVADLASSGHAEGRAKRDIRDEIVRMVDLAANTDAPWATSVLDRWATEGAERDYEEAHKSLNVTTYIRADGRRVKKTTSYSQPKRAAETGDVVYVQATFWDWTLEELTLKRDEMLAQEERLADVVQAMNQLIDAWKLHPEAQTAREAWESAGHSVNEIDLSEAA